MTTGEQDQLAAIARDAGHAAKDGAGFANMTEEEQAVFNYGVHIGREAIRHGVDKENARVAIDNLALQTAAAIATFTAFIDGTVPNESWAS